MWECKYGKEPLDLRLCALRLIRKWWILLIMGILGAILFGGIYFLKTVVYAPAREYIAESDFYVEYKNAVTEEQQYTFYNKETWETLIHTDLFLQTIIKEVGEPVGEMYLKEALFATLLTDVRVVHATVKTNSSELTMKISKAMEKAFVQFGEQQREVDEIRVISSPTSAEVTKIDNRTFRAVILGGVVFLVFTLLGMYLYAILDTSIWLPIEFERLFSIKMEIANDDKKQSNQSVWVEESQKGYVIYVKSGDHNRQLVESQIRNLTLDGKKMIKAVLVNPDRKLIQDYMDPLHVMRIKKRITRGE